MKKILLILNSGLVNAGVPNVIMNIVSHMKNEMQFDAFVCNSNESFYDAQFMSYGGHVFRMNIEKYTKHRLLFLIKGLEIFFKTYSLLKKEHYDIVHCNNGLESGICVSAAKIAGVKTRITHCHGKYKKRSGKNLPLRLYEWFCRKWIFTYSTDKLTCSSEAGVSLFGNDSTVINMLNPVDLSIYCDIKKNLDKKCINILQIGYFCTNKNQIFSIKMLRLLLDKGENAHLSLIGYEYEPGYLRAMLDIVNDLKLWNKVTILPHDYNKPKIFAKTDVLVIPSLSEGLSLVALEAQAANICCFASKNVPMDANLGLCTFISLEDVNTWIDKLAVVKEQVYASDKEKIKRIDSNNYANIIRKIYQKN